MPRSRRGTSKDARRNTAEGSRMRRTRRVFPVLMLSAVMLLSSVALVSSPASSDPVDINNPDDTHTLVWGFDNASDYNLNSASVGGGVASLTIRNETVAEDSQADFVLGTRSNIDISTYPGSLVLDSTVESAATVTYQPISNGIDSYISEAKTERQLRRGLRPHAGLRGQQEFPDPHAVRPFRHPIRRRGRQRHPVALRGLRRQGEPRHVRRAPADHRLERAGRDLEQVRHDQLLDHCRGRLRRLLVRPRDRGQHRRLEVGQHHAARGAVGPRDDGEPRVHHGARARRRRRLEGVPELGLREQHRLLPEARGRLPRPRRVRGLRVQGAGAWHQLHIHIRILVRFIHVVPDGRVQRPRALLRLDLAQRPVC